MAEVFKAEHRRPGEIRGLKVKLPASLARSPLVVRLLDEARILARSRHPAIAEIHDCDVQGDSAFLVMEHLPGITLRSWCSQVGKLARNPGLAAAIAGVLADGLAFAHQQGVVHGDLTPDNVLLVPVSGDEDGFWLKILDFGLARLVRTQAVRATPPAGLAGSRPHLAPAPWRAGEPIDQRTDVHALGCILFELLCGRPPGDPAPDLTVLEPEVPSRLQSLLGKMLARSPDARPSCMEEVLVELEGISGRRRSRWSEMLRTPAAGVMAARGTLVIPVEQTIVDRPGIRLRLLVVVHSLLHRLRKLPLAWSGARRKLLPAVHQLQDVWQRRPKLDRFRRLPDAAAAFVARIRPALLAFFRRTLSTRPRRLAVIVATSVIVGSALLWSTRFLLPAPGDAAPPQPVPVTVPAPAPAPAAAVVSRPPTTRPRPTAAPIERNDRVPPSARARRVRVPRASRVRVRRASPTNPTNAYRAVAD